MNYRDEVNKSYDAQRAPTFASIAASRPQGTMRGPRSDLAVTVGETVSHLLPSIGGNIEKLGWGNRLNAGDYIGSGVEGALSFTPIGRAAGPVASRAVARAGNSVVNRAANAFYSQPFDASRRLFLQNTAAVPASMASAATGALLNNTARKLAYVAKPASRLDPYAAEEMKFFTSMLAKSPADKFFHSATMSSPHAIFDRLAKDIPMSRRDALKTIGTSTAMLPKGVAPFHRMNQFMQGVPTFNKGPIPYINGGQATVQALKPIYRDAGYASAMAAATQIGKSLNTPVSRRDLVKGMATAPFMRPF